jgi:hypothetical protein
LVVYRISQPSYVGYVGLDAKELCGLFTLKIWSWKSRCSQVLLKEIRSLSLGSRGQHVLMKSDEANNKKLLLKSPFLRVFHTAQRRWGADVLCMVELDCFHELAAPSDWWIDCGLFPMPQLPWLPWLGIVSTTNIGDFGDGRNQVLMEKLGEFLFYHPW